MTGFSDHDHHTLRYIKIRTAAGIHHDQAVAMVEAQQDLSLK